MSRLPAEAGQPGRSARPKLVAEGVRIEYHDPVLKQRTLALEAIDLEIVEGEFFTIVGPSGCGKTTFLNAVDGLIPLTAGRIMLDGHEITSPGPDRAMVFQSASLLPWRSVIDNISYGLECQGMPHGRAVERAREFIPLVGLDGFERHYPYQLSGGMQQRVNLARALIVDPQILLMDEPFASLDAQTRELMQTELLRIWNRARKTVIFITHQVSEAIYLSDRVAVFGARPGRVKEIVAIDLPRPRGRETKRDPRTAEYEDYIWQLIRPDLQRAMREEQVGAGTGARLPEQ